MRTTTVNLHSPTGFGAALNYATFLYHKTNATMKTILITLLILVGVNHTSLAQLKTVDRQVIVMFKPSVVERPLGRSTYGLEDLTIPNEVRQILTESSVVQVDKPFPNFSSRDTVRTLRGGRIYRTPDYSNLYVFTLPEVSDRNLLISALVSSGYVEYAELNAALSPRTAPRKSKPPFHDDTPRLPYTPVIPTDPDFYLQWGLLNNSGMDINATNAWTITTGDPSIVIGIIDTGVESSNVDLSGKVTGKGEYNGHGTMVAGIAAAKANNTGGRIVGVDWEAQIFSGHASSLPTAAEDIDAAVLAGAKVINNSWGRDSTSTLLTNALIDAYAADVSLVHANPYASSKNPDLVSNYPNSIGPWIINVGAMTQNGTPIDNSASKPYTDVGAPGFNILSTLGTTWASETGTSFAAPFVTGTISLMLAANPDLKNYEIEQVLKRTAQG